jgi:hypothetical protein
VHTGSQSTTSYFNTVQVLVKPSRFLKRETWEKSPQGSNHTLWPGEEVPVQYCTGTRRPILVPEDDATRRSSAAAEIVGGVVSGQIG